MKVRNQILLSGPATIAMLASAAPAMAQDAAEAAPAGEATGTNEILVTAQKREPSPQEAPHSMAVVRGAKLAAFNSCRQVESRVGNEGVRECRPQGSQTNDK